MNKRGDDGMIPINSLKIGAASIALLTYLPSSYAQTPPPTPTTSDTLEEVVVTAQKRVENAQKAPLAVTSLSNVALADAHVVGATDLERVVPNVHVDLGGSTGDPSGSNALFSIRGLGASTAGTQGSAGVAVHSDGIYRNNGVSNSEFFDIERIEVDPGPQGTLYGRAAAAGAVNILPNKPTDKLEGEATLELGNYGAVRSEGMLNVPVTDQLYVRGAFQTQNHDGYLSNGYDDLDAVAGRLQVLDKPTDDLSIRLYGDYTHLGGRGAGDIFIGGPALPGLAAIVPQVATGNIRDRSIAQYCVVNGQVVASCVQSVNDNEWSAHLEANYNVGWGVLTLLPAYHEHDLTSGFANAPLPLSNYDLAPFDDRQKNFEVRLNDPGDTPIKWVGGISIYHNEIDERVNQSINPLTTLPVFGNGPPIPTGFAPGVVEITALNDFAAQQDSYAAFGQATYPVLDWLRLTSGGRYNYDSASYNGSLSTNSQKIYYVNGPIFASPINSPVLTGPLSSAERERAFTFRFAIDADLTPDSLAYASVGTGYKPGGLNDGGPASANTPGQLAILGNQLTPPQTATQLVGYAPNQAFGPEKVTHYEIGTKNQFLNDRLQINDSFYYDDYSSYQNGQTQVVNPLIFRAQGFITTNAGQSKLYGNELAIKFKVAPTDLITLNANYLHASFTSYIAPAFLTPSGPVPSTNLTGYRLPNAPEWSGNLSYQHFFDLADGSEIVTSIFTHLTSAYWVYFAESPGTHQGAYTNTTLDLSWTSSDQSWLARLFVNNTEDRDIKSFGQNNTGYSLVHLDPPRTYGASLTFHFSADEPSPPVAESAAPPPAPMPTAAPAPEMQRSFEVFFDFDRSTITDAAARVIRAAADTVKAGGVAKIAVTGHTDTVGTARYNHSLSERRAAAVKEQLVADGVDSSEVIATGVGKNGLLVPTADGVREPQNRRAEIELR